MKGEEGLLLRHKKHFRYYLFRNDQPTHSDLSPIPLHVPFQIGGIYFIDFVLSAKIREHFDPVKIAIIE